MQVLNFYSTIFADELKRGRKTATIRLGDKSGKYRKNQLVLVTIGYQHSPRERIFEAVIDQVEVMKLADLSPRDIKHDNPEFRRHEELISFLEQIYGRSVSPRGRRDGRALLADPRHPDGHDRGDEGLRRRAELARAPGAVSPRRSVGSFRCKCQLPLMEPRIVYIFRVTVGTLRGECQRRSAPGRRAGDTRDARSTL